MYILPPIASRKQKISMLEKFSRAFLKSNSHSAGGASESSLKRGGLHVVKKELRHLYVGA